MNLDTLLEKMWGDYIKLNPEAQKIHDLFIQSGDKVVNDHVAFRTFQHPKTGVQSFSKVFRDLGYKKKGEYKFEEKKLYAEHFEHPEENRPKIFISELLLNEFSESLQEKAYKYINQVPLDTVSSPEFCLSGRSWDISFREYEELKKESEYAAWLSAFGFTVNHFTVLINELKNFKKIEDVNSFIKKNGYQLNDSGGEIKGSSDVLLEQSSTLANNQEIQFIDGKKTIPSCYYEFALRYPDSTGKLYQGFVAKSADKIFESTDRGQ